MIHYVHKKQTVPSSFWVAGTVVVDKWWAETDELAAIDDFERSLNRIKPVTRGYRYGFLEGTKSVP
jgi:hypothetical protein